MRDDRATVTIHREAFSVTVTHRDLDLAREVAGGVEIVWATIAGQNFDLDLDAPQEVPRTSGNGSTLTPAMRFTAVVGHPDAVSCHRYALHLVRLAEQMQADARGASIVCTMPERTISSEVGVTVAELMKGPRL